MLRLAHDALPLRDELCNPLPVTWAAPQIRTATDIAFAGNPESLRPVFVHENLCVEDDEGRRTTGGLNPSRYCLHGHHVPLCHLSQHFARTFVRPAAAKPGDVMR
jgi:hypothetical protein